ncbi:MAG: hypothetical protein ACLSAC_17355 [Enterocloster bolteae]
MKKKLKEVTWVENASIEDELGGVQPCRNGNYIDWSVIKRAFIRMAANKSKERGKEREGHRNTGRMVEERCRGRPSGKDVCLSAQGQ